MSENLSDPTQIMKIHCRTFNISLTNGNADMEDEAAVSDFMQQVYVTKIYASIVNDRDPYWSILVFYSEEPILHEESHPTLNRRDALSETDNDIVLTPDENEIFQALRQWRAERGHTDGIAAYIIAHDRSLKQIVRRRDRIPHKQALRQIHGFGSRKVEKYGDDILAVLRHFDPR